MYDMLRNLGNVLLGGDIVLQIRRFTIGVLLVPSLLTVSEYVNEFLCVV